MSQSNDARPVGWKTTLLLGNKNLIKNLGIKPIVLVYCLLASTSGFARVNTGISSNSLYVPWYQSSVQTDRWVLKCRVRYYVYNPRMDLQFIYLSRYQISSKSVQKLNIKYLIIRQGKDSSIHQSTSPISLLSLVIMMRCVRRGIRWECLCPAEGFSWLMMMTMGSYLKFPRSLVSVLIDKVLVHPDVCLPAELITGFRVRHAFYHTTLLHNK